MTKDWCYRHFINKTPIKENTLHKHIKKKKIINIKMF